MSHHYYSPPRGGWDCREFTDPFSNLPPAFFDDGAPSTSFFSPLVGDGDGDNDNGETETRRRQRRRERRRDLIASQDSDAVPETPQTNEKSAFEEDDVDDRRNSPPPPPLRNRTNVFFLEEEDDDVEENHGIFPNALVVAPTSSRDCGVTASLLFARCARECVLSNAREEEENATEKSNVSNNNNNNNSNNNGLNENGNAEYDTNESDARRRKRDGIFLPKALFVCHRDALESETFAAPSVAETSSLSEEYIAARAAKRVSIKYASTDEDVVKIMSALHVLPVEELPSLIAVCDVSAFSDRSGGNGMGGNRERTAAHARVCAAIVEAARYSTMARRKAMRKSNRDGWRSRVPTRCKVVVSERKDDMEDANMLAKKDWQHEAGMDGMMMGGEETKYYNRYANAGTGANASNNTGSHPLTYATKRWFERVFVVRKKDGYEEEVVEVGKVGGGAYEVIDCATGAKSTYIATLGAN